ncbi:MAG: RecQ family ATP-dependent DNA helicase [Planctomycetes bacterium]|nr:RecQ family ATP-dependent DNA helicase [Planctomycetota bacterium]
MVGGLGHRELAAALLPVTTMSQSWWCSYTAAINAERLVHAVGFDLELGRDERLHAFGALAGERTLTGKRGAELAALNGFVAGAPFVFGHNVLWHDLPWLRENASESALLRLPVVDTLVLSVLAFPEHPYHALVKDHKLVAESLPDPVRDCMLAQRLLRDGWHSLQRLAAARPRFFDLLMALVADGLRSVGGDLAAAGWSLFAPSRALSANELDGALQHELDGLVCLTALHRLGPVAGWDAARRLVFAFALSWLRVAGKLDGPVASVPMPWVRRRFPELSSLLHSLRDVRCGEPSCNWCVNAHDPVGWLSRWYGFPSFRPQPALPDGSSLQQAVAAAGFADRPLLALMPTGGGKSLCFQLPAIARSVRRGCLTVVISPLQALMLDQVVNFERTTGLKNAAALNGLLTPPERRATLEAVRSGACGLLYLAPEQLRNRSVKAVLRQREIGAWVFDEAHCLAKWGHDFRPDYLYAARCIGELAAEAESAPAPVVCVTATARPEVRDEIVRHFRDVLGQQLEVFDGTSERANLELGVESCAAGDKFERLHALVAAQLGDSLGGCVLVYTATRKQTEVLANRLRACAIDALEFHAGLEPPEKKRVQAAFVAGEVRVICATNAFGMGVDKPDIRLVVHHEIPGSIENYVQEVGRAGRDGAPARAVLLFAPADIETQFRLAAGSRLHQSDLQAILKRVRSLARSGRERKDRVAICTTGEILRDPTLAQEFDPGDRGAPTRVVTAVAWLERGQFLRRDENRPVVFSGRPLVRDLDEARRRIAELRVAPATAAVWLSLLQALLTADVDQGLNEDDLALLPAIAAADPVRHGGRSAVIDTLVAMQKARLLSNGLRMTAFVRAGIADSSRARLLTAQRLLDALFDLLPEHAPDADGEAPQHLHVPLLQKALHERGIATTAPELRRVVEAAAATSTGAAPGSPGLRVHAIARDRLRVHVRGGWPAVKEQAALAMQLAAICLEELLRRVDRAEARGKDLLVEFGFEDLVAAIDRQLPFAPIAQAERVPRVERALLLLHGLDVVVLHRGLAVFRQAMTLTVPDVARARFTRADFAPIDEHQHERTVQIHAMHEFAERMVQDRRTGLRLLADWFRLDQPEFLQRWFGGRRQDVERPTSSQSWHAIVDSLSPVQREIVGAEDDASLLVLAGPGSGKTRVVVHRCAWLLRVRRVPASAILVLCFNRSAAFELRRRLRELVGGDADGVTVQTYHGLASRLCGRWPDGADGAARAFDGVIDAAVALLQGDAEAAANAGDEELRDSLLAGYRHILVDEYQDIDDAQYRLVSAIAGRTLGEAEHKLAILAVGDDDQNIYSWRGSSTRFLRAFQTDYQAESVPLVENFRSTGHIVAAANGVIAMVRERMKVEAPIRVDSARANGPAGGRFAALDPRVQGRVHVLEVAAVASQAAVVLAEIERLRACDSSLTLDQCAILSARHAPLDPVRALAEARGLPVRVRVDAERSFSLFLVREVQEFLAAVTALPGNDVKREQLTELLAAARQRRCGERWLDLVQQVVDAFGAEHGDASQPKTLVAALAGELLGEQRRERIVGQGVLLGTVHGVKGAEFDHVRARRRLAAARKRHTRRAGPAVLCRDDPGAADVDDGAGAQRAHADACGVAVGGRVPFGGRRCGAAAAAGPLRTGRIGARLSGLRRSSVCRGAGPCGAGVAGQRLAAASGRWAKPSAIGRRRRSIRRHGRR